MLAPVLIPLVGLAACATGTAPASAQARASAPAPAGTAGASPSTQAPDAAASCSGRPTPAETEGPYFKAGSPERASLVEAGLPGTSVVVSGRVLTLDCRSLAGVVLDFWQADASGAYDNAGYRLRGHLTTDSDGRYSLQTIAPGDYASRTQHIHVKVEAPGRPVLTTQLYFPGDPGNARDGLYERALEMRLAKGEGSFDFVVEA